jgi:hypothetical protein
MRPEIAARICRFAYSYPRRNGTSHCQFMQELGYATGMNRRMISAAYYYPEEVGIG